MTNEERDEWHLDRKVSIAMLFTILTTFIIAMGGYIELRAQVSEQQKQLDEAKGLFNQIQHTLIEMKGVIVKVETRQETMLKGLDRVLDNQDRHWDRSGSPARKPQE